MKSANYIMIVLFAIAAIVQYNDPDPFRWIAVYLGAIAICLLFAWDQLPTTLAFVYAAACLVAGLVLFIRALERTSWQWDEGVNEPAGLFAIFLWISTLAWTKWKGKGQALT